MGYYYTVVIMKGPVQLITAYPYACWGVPELQLQPEGLEAKMPAKPTHHDVRWLQIDHHLGRFPDQMQAPIAVKDARISENAPQKKDNTMVSNRYYALCTTHADK